MTVSSPVLATALTFATYVLTSTEEDPHLLTAADTFGVLLLFGALRFPINFAGRLIGNAAQALSAIRRIVVFLERPLRKSGSTLLLGDDEPENDTDKTPLVLTKARFRVGIPAETSASERSLEDSKTTSDNSNNNTEDADHDETDTTTSAVEHGGSRDNQSFTVGDFDFQLQRGEVMVVCGPVGSGKSTLLNGILGEAEEVPLPNEDGAVTVTPMVQKGGRISFAPQDPFVLNLSLRENILFGSDLDTEKYNRVLDACALRPDIAQLGGSDLVQIGERGVTLSGGQRQRVSLARAAYKADESSCVILDDPFSALDSGTGRLVFERLLAAKDALLRNSAVLLVTHASHFISHRAVDKVLLMVNGRNEFLGTWEELTTFNDEEHDEQTRRAVDHIQSQVRENTEDDEAEGEKEKNKHDEARDSRGESSKDTSTKNGNNRLSPSNGDKIMQKELREHGLSSMKTWLLWFKRAGGAWFGITVVVLMAIDRFAYVAVEWFLALWANGAYEPVNVLGFEFPPQSDGYSAQSLYLKVYFTINFVSIFSTAIRSEFAVTGGVRATKNVFNSMLASVLRAPMSYFETVPMGRILNRFTYDTDVNDVTLTQMLSMFIISCSWYLAGVVVQISIMPWSVMALFPVSLLYLVFMHYYRMTGPDLQRIDALSRSPMQSMVSECLEGSTSIRVFHQDSNFVRKFEGVVDVNSSALLNYVSVQRWLSVRMELLGSVVVMTTTVLVVCLNDRLQTSAGLAGLLITWGSNFTITLNFLVQTFTETEAAITAIERVDAMADLPTEKAMETPKEHVPHPDWPEKGLLEFRNVSLRYREGLPLALNDLSFAIPAGKTCGIVGRTGAVSLS
jgi:ABC-type multidrug transport system fused ATPase/permease subunit